MKAPELRCPACGSVRSGRYRSPVEKQDVILRRHQCEDCQHIFLSAQTVVTPRLTERLLPALD